MKKIILLFAMILAVAGVQAKTDKYYCNVTLTAAGSGNPTYTNGTYSWSAASTNYMWIFNDLSVDISHYKHLRFTISDKSPDDNNCGFQIEIYGSNDQSTYAYHKDYYSSKTVDIDLTQISLTENSKNYSYSDIKRILIRGVSSSGSFKITAEDIYLESDEYEAMDITTSITTSSDATTPFEWKTNGSNTISVINDLNCSQSKGYYFGYNSDNDLNHGYFDLTGYDKVKVTLANYNSSNSTQMRLIAGEGTTNTINFAEGTFVYEQALTTTKCATIRAAQGAGNHQSVTSIDFIKEFAASSTTAFSIAASASSSVAYDREFTAGQKYTVCLPFSTTGTEAGGTFYQFESVSDETLNFTALDASTATTAYTPYIFVPSGTLSVKPFANLANKAIVASSGATTAVTQGDYTFKGTLAHSDNVQGDNGSNTVFGLKGGDGTFVKVTGTSVAIDAFRAYIIVSGSAQARALTRGFFDVNLGDGTTSIQKTETLTEDIDAPAYNLSGQRVDANYKGLVIKNGRKYFVK